MIQAQYYFAAIAENQMRMQDLNLMTKAVQATTKYIRVPSPVAKEYKGKKKKFENAKFSI